MIEVKKKDGKIEQFNPAKIIQAVAKAAFRVSHPLTDAENQQLVRGVKSKIITNPVTVSELHEIVIATMHDIGLKDVAESYAEYRYYKVAYAQTFEKLRQDADDVLHLGDRENANFDSSLISTKGSLIKGYLTKSLYKQFYLSRRERELIDRGDIYIHDLRDMLLGSVNCCLFDIGTVLKGGFEMSNVDYTEPKSVLSALQVIGDITLVATAQQFGGFTLAELDKVLLPYCKKTMQRAAVEFEFSCPEPKSLKDFKKAQRDFAHQQLEYELRQGFQSLELKLNTVPSSRGDFAFTTITFAHWNPDLPEEDRFLMYHIGRILMQTRRNGHGKNHKPVVFPKLVFLYDKNLVENDKFCGMLFDEAVKTSAQCMYPDYLSLTSERGTVSRIYKEQGVITSPMGCRAYLSPWKNEQGRYITIGRCNIGAVSLNVPLILKATQLEHPDNWKEQFWNELDDRMDVIREFLRKRYEFISKQKCSSNPLAFTQGGFYEGFKNPDDTVGNLIRYMTASFGITALDEATYLWSGKRLIEDHGKFANEVLKHIQARINQYKKEDGYLYALYATPAESLCATQAQQFADFCQEHHVENDFANNEHYSTEYFTNSFHCNVTEEITPFEKQDAELENFHSCEGGHIQYVRIDNPENLDALKAVIQRGMEMGFYQGVNFDSAYCEDCGQHSTNVLFECPHCGSKNLTVISRVCGYLGYSNVNGHSRMNDGKMEEIRRRKSM